MNNCLFGPSPEKSLGNIDSSSQGDYLQPTVQEIASYSARLISIAESVLEIPVDPITQAGLHFLALRNNQTIEDYCMDAIRCSMDVDLAVPMDH
jgi:hypothetical protein